MKVVIKSIWANYAVALLLWFVLFLCFVLGLAFVGIEHETIRNITAAIAAAMVAFGDIATIEPLDHKELLFLGRRTEIWLDPGYYFLFFVFSFFESETQHEEKKDVIVLAFQCQDSKGKTLTVEANGDWEIVDPSTYELFEEKEMVTNLQALIRRTAVRVCGILVYKTHILGKDLGERILENPIFKRETKKYGIEFSNLLADAVAFDLKQENINSYRSELYEAEVAKYPDGYLLSPEEKKHVEERVEVALGLADKFISDIPVQGKYEIGESKGGGRKPPK
jgi:hypothetical protein